EATGPYSAALAAYLHAAGRLVSVANPARVKAHTRACGQANKTDPADARAIASFCRDRQPRLWVPPSPEVRALQGLVRRRAELPPVEQLPSAGSAAADVGLAPREFTSGKSVKKHTRLSKAGNARLRAALDLPTLTAIRSDPLLKRFFDRLVAAGKPKMQAVG